jgi:nicotinamide-nucleotide amidase
MNQISECILKKIRRFFKMADQYIVNRFPENQVLKEKTIEIMVSEYLIEHNATIALAESCTGGLLAHRLTNMAGSSDYFLFSGVTYSNESKIKVLGVSPATIEKYGAVHEETAEEMARGAMQIANSTYGLSTTGIAGPSGGTKEKPVGTVCVGMATSTMSIGRRFNFQALNRFQNKEAFATAALKLFLSELDMIG